MDRGNGTHYYKMGTLSQGRILIATFCFLALAAFAVWAPRAEARSGYLAAFTTKYPVTVGTKLDDCGVCHGSNTSSWNSYGQAIRSIIDTRVSDATLTAALVTVEPLNSDGVGGTNIQEINALTFPGDPNDPPQSANRAPVAANDSYNVNAGATLTVPASSGVLANDSDPDSDPLTAVLASGPSSGTFSLSANGSFTYTPTVSSGQVTFTYRANDGKPTNNLSNVATVSITVSAAANTAPVANADSGYSTPTNTALNVVAPGVLGNDTDANSDPLTAIKVTDPAHGTVTLNANGSFTYTPTASYSGPDSFTYRANDGTANSNTATVTITITSVNDAPVAADKAVTTNPETPVAVTLTATDADGNSLTYAVVAGPSNGTLSGTAPNLTYTPNTGFSGSDSFTYKANDGTDDSNTATVSITVTGDTTPPTGVTGFPESGSNEVPVTTVVTATGNEISTVVDPFTFTLTEDLPVAITTSLSESDDDDHSQCVSEGMVLGDITYNTSNTVATFTPKCPLKESTIYTATITPPAGVQQSVLAETMSWSFTTIAMTPDSDGDGDPDAGDDSPKDCRNATPGVPKGKGKIKITLDGHPNGCFKKIKATSETDPSVIPTGMPSGYEFRDGIIAYEIVGISTGETDTVTLIYPEAFPAGSKVYKVDSGGFYEYPDAVIDGNTVTLKVTDGGYGDMDETTDGRILDPVGVAVPAASGGGTIDLSTDAAGGGCSVVGDGGGWKEAAGSYGLLALVWLGLALRRRKPESGR